MSELLSVVVPCYNEEEVIAETYRQLTASVKSICEADDLKYEIIFVNDGSKDRTLSLLQDLQEKHSDPTGEVRVVALSRNFGHQLALTAGLQFASGDAVVAIDADLQDPPEVIANMVHAWRQGVDVAYGVRDTREGETWFKLATARLFYKTMHSLTRIDIPLDTGDFRLMSRRALDVFNSMPERHRFIRGMIPWIGFRQEPVKYARKARFAGTTKYPLSKMLHLAFDGITSFSNAPLKTAYIVGVVVATLSVLFAIYIITRQLLTGFAVSGWSSIMVAVLFLGAVQLISIGILGDYIGRIYDQVKQRPMFIVDDINSRNTAPTVRVPLLHKSNQQQF